MNLSLEEVLSRYALQRDWTALVVADDCDEGVAFGWAAFGGAAFGAIWIDCKRVMWSTCLPGTRSYAQCVAGRAAGIRIWQRFARSRLAKNNWLHFASVVYVRLLVMASIALRLASSSARRIARFPTPSLSQTKRTRLTPRRNLHTRTPLPYDIDNGLGDFLTPQALRMIAIDYQQGLLDRLNEQVAGVCLSISLTRVSRR